MLKLKHIVLLVLVFPLIACSRLSVLNPKGIIAASEAHMLIFSTLLMLIVVIPVVILSFLIPWRYRANNSKASYRPEWSHSTLLEVIWWSIPCIIILILAIATWVSTHRLDPYRPLVSDKKPLEINAIALNWKWLFIYPEQNIATVNFLKIPLNRPISFVITSDAPMNSLEIPQLAGQIYAMTGMQTRLHLMANKKGTYDGLSTNFSGDGFSDMRFRVNVDTEDQFKIWVKNVKKQSHPLTAMAYQELTHDSANNPVEYFSSAEKGLFNMAIMKYMGCMSAMGMNMKMAER